MCQLTVNIEIQEIQWQEKRKILIFENSTDLQNSFQSLLTVVARRSFLLAASSNTR